MKFYDTSSLLVLGSSILNIERFLISSVTFQELENIKNSNKDADIKYTARLILRILDQHPEIYEVIIHRKSYEDAITKLSIDINNDTKILSDAFWCNNYWYTDSITFVTNDLALKHIANLFFGEDSIEAIKEISDDYTGFKEISVDDPNLAIFYEHPEENVYNLNIGQYIIVYEDNKVVDVRVWTGIENRYLNYEDFYSIQFGKVSPYKNDIYQKLLFDSLCNNEFTIIRGSAGVGKSYIALAYLFYALEHGKIDKIVIFCNNVAAKDTAKLGFYPGSKDEKLLGSQVGAFLTSKIGGIEEVERLINEGVITLIPMADSRGIEIGSRTGVYVTEAQNTTIDIMQLII